MSLPLIAFLDTLGRLPPGDDYRARVAALDVAPALREALVGRDAEALARAFGATAALWCMIATPEDAPKPEEQPDDEPGRRPDDEPEPRPGPEPA